MYKKKTVPSDNELTIVSFLIMRTEVLSFFYKKYKEGQIKTIHFGDYFRPIIRWLVRYYGEYKRAPKHTITQIFRQKSKSLGDAVELVEEYLFEASELYGELEEDVYDVNYIINEVLINFVNEQETTKLIDQLSNDIEKGEIENVEKTLSEYKKLTSAGDEEALSIDMPFTEEAVEDYYQYQESGGDNLFKLDGAVGKIIGNFAKKKFYAITGVEKAGKTRFMTEIAYVSTMVHNQRVLWINCEMPEDDIREIFWQRFTERVAEKEYAKKLVYPIFDCLNNQLCRCEVREKQLNRDRLFSITTGKPIPFSQNKSWKTCLRCRGKRRARYRDTKRFIPAVWFGQNRKRFRILNRQKLVEELKGNTTKIRRFKNLRIKTFPRLSVTLTQIIDFIYRYIEKHNWHPHMIIFDYLDIVAPQVGALLDRQNVDFIWKKAAGLSAELDCAILTADQALKAARNKRSLGQGDTSESKTKDAHIDARITLNMTPEEQELGLQRVGLIFRRKGKIYQSQVMTLQRRETADTVLDSEWWLSTDPTFYVKK